MGDMIIILPLPDENHVERMRKKLEEYLRLNFLREFEIFIRKDNSNISVFFKRDTSFSSRIQNVLDFAKLNYQEDVSLEQAASKIFLSKYHFEKIFTAQIGMPFKKFLNCFRLCRAAEILRLNSLPSVTDVCFETGFGDFSNLEPIQELLIFLPFQYPCHLLSPPCNW